MKPLTLAVTVTILVATSISWSLLMPINFWYDLRYLPAVPTVYLLVALFDRRIATNKFGVLYILPGVVLTILLGLDLQAFSVTVKITAALLGLHGISRLRSRIAAI